MSTTKLHEKPHKEIDMFLTSLPPERKASAATFAAAKCGEEFLKTTAEAKAIIRTIIYIQKQLDRDFLDREQLNSCLEILELTQRMFVLSAGSEVYNGVYNEKEGN